MAYHDGVTTAVTAPTGKFVQGLSAAFAVGADSVLEKNAIVQREVALHISISRGSTASVSTQIAALRRLLIGDHTDSHSNEAFSRLQGVSKLADLCLPHSPALRVA